jgi:hypothetical protein
MTTDIDFAFDYSYSFKTGEYEYLAIEIKNIPLEAFVAVRNADYDDNDDFESLNGLSGEEKIKLIDENSLFLLNLEPYKDIIDITLIDKNKMDCTINKIDKKLTLEGAIKIAEKVRSELSARYNLNYNFVDYCDLCAEEVEKELIKNDYICEIKNEYYIHKFKDEKLKTYGHCWVECDGLIIDPSRDQFDSNEFALKKELNKNYTSNKKILKNKKSGLKFK